MKRPLFCEICPMAYKISAEKEIIKRQVSDLMSNKTFAKKRDATPLAQSIYTHNSLIRRRLGNVDMTLQENKATNLALASAHINGVIIRPGETFSLWKLVGRTTAGKGYREGLTIARGKPSKGIGGGLCQLSNLIHWMVLHSDLTITEHHHHDGLDLFPDFGRQIPFGTGTSITYNYLDYRVENNTDNTYQLLVWVDGEYLRGELRAEKKQHHIYHIQAEDEFFSNENGVIYRNGKVYRNMTDPVTGKVISHQLIRTNHAKVMYVLPEGTKVRAL